MASSRSSSCNSERHLPPLLSAVIITRDEERNIAECIASLGGVADEVVVLDSGSTDRTTQIACALGARVAQREFDGFGPQKQAALELATGEWILSIDADERLTPPLVEEIRRVIASPDAADGYEVRRELVYLGKPLRYGGTERDWVLRLARRSVARFSPDVIHEHLAVRGRTARLSGTMLHRKWCTIGAHLAQMDRYTAVIAARKAARGSRFASWHVLRIPWELFVRLVVRRGVLDGRVGVIHAGMAAFYAFLKYARLYERELSDA